MEQLISDKEQQVVITLKEETVTRTIGEIEELLGYYERQITDKNEQIRRDYQRICQIKATVRDAFKEQIESKDDSANFDYSEANELLESIHAERLKFTWSGTVTFTVTVSNIEADSEEGAESVLEDAFEVKLNRNQYSDVMDWDVETEVSDIEEEEE
jgi:hypothetical protein